MHNNECEQTIEYNTLLVIVSFHSLLFPSTIRLIRTHVVTGEATV